MADNKRKREFIANRGDVQGTSMIQALIFSILHSQHLQIEPCCGQGGVDVLIRAQCSGVHDRLPRRVAQPCIATIEHQGRIQQSKPEPGLLVHPLLGQQGLAPSTVMALGELGQAVLGLLGGHAQTGEQALVQQGQTGLLFGQKA